MILPQPPNLPYTPLVVPALVQAISPPSVALKLKQANSGMVYNVTTPPNLQQSRELQAIVDEAVSLAAAKGLPQSPLSMTLIDVKSGEIAGYQQQQLNYPASLVKLFWMVALYAEVESGIIPNERALASDLYNMIHYSDNDAASRILDKITDTQSGSSLYGQNYQTWLQKRNQINQFFQLAGYNNLNISQKVYPIGYLDLDLPEGRELQMRGDQKNPIRNMMTTDHAARLLYEIFTGQSVSPAASQKMAQLLTRDLRPEAAEDDDSTYIENLLGESLPVDVYLAAKAGWTSSVRHHAAYVSSRDGQTAYIIVIFTSDRAYIQNQQIFPTISRLVFDRMTARSSLK
jgi:beta-lactamase class A